ncbi:MAG: DUF2723 domain-containing protein [Muribaculaceae bacterium]|nr:DUF2723 domain-containing protein [Muribaculaceae bacterium]
MKVDISRYKIFSLADRIVSWVVFLTLLTTYWFTVAPTVSLWDCPEYVTAAWRLEVGHPPGNPFWMLVERIVTMCVPARYAALAVNLSSGLFTALAGMLLAKCIFIGAVWVLKTRDGFRRRLHAVYASGAALVGALAFGWGDSVWYSAVEAEVYAMSIFLTALALWLMLLWARASSPARGRRLLVLLAYVFGLSLGVHQLNLLVIPALAVIWALRRGLSPWWKVISVFCVAMAGVGCILAGMMPSTISLAARFELYAVNRLHLPSYTGVAFYIGLLGLSLIMALTVSGHSSNRGLLSLAIFPALFLSGLFVFGDLFRIGLATAALVALILPRLHRMGMGRLNLAMWMLAMLLAGYSVYALIPIRGWIPAPANAVMPGEPFSFAAYQAREQYGGAPLLFGNTPYSRPLYQEEWLPGDTLPVYRRYAIAREQRQLERFRPGARFDESRASQRLSKEDSIFNAGAIADGRGYVVKGYRCRYVLTPELDMWLPRLTSRDARDIEAFESWVGMTKDNMERVPVSEALDSAGVPVARVDGSGKRREAYSYRPTVAQNLQYMLSYQMGYMCLRYLMWNFCGRQNDMPSTGEIEHGNFITGITPVDNLMLGAEESLPDYAGKENPGRNRYFMLPLLLGLWGIVWLLRSNWRGRLACAVVAVLFLMTGLAITVYLNQSPGEPRERDYTFLGAYMAFSIWIGAGALGLARVITELALRRRTSGKPPRIKRLLAVASAAFIPSLAINAWMLGVNFDDHDRSGREVAAALGANILNSLEPDAILFVDGDNFTFPLWYAQEVEGIRRDVRVVNLAYLSVPRYAANMMADWEGNPGLRSVLKPEDILYQAYTQPMVGHNSMRLTALEALNRLRASRLPEFEGEEVELLLPDSSSTTLRLSALSRSGAADVLEFRKLMMLDFIASNSIGDNARPVYWMKNLPGHHFLGLDRHLSEGLFAVRLGNLSQEVEDSLLIKGLRKLRRPNRSRDVYLDQTPAHTMARMRADITSSALRLLHNGHKEEALDALKRMELEYGDEFATFATVQTRDTIFRTTTKYIELLRALGDSLQRPELSSRADSLECRDQRRRDHWSRYRRALPPRMRSRMATP